MRARSPPLPDSGSGRRRDGPASNHHGDRIASTPPLLLGRGGTTPPYYYWGARRARSAPGSGGCNPPPPALPPTKIQSSRRGEKRKFLFASSCPPAWGAKRARSPICGGGDDVIIKPVDPVPGAAQEGVDWANLGDGPAGLIAELVLANDVADYVRFRAVCQPWRRCSPDPRAGGLDGRFLPRRWIMLDKAVTASPRCHRFLNISTGESIRMGLPELADHRFLAVTPEGLLLLLHEPTLAIRLLNPLTRQLTTLPPVTTLLGELISLQVYGVGLAHAASTVAVCFTHPTVLAVAKPGDVCWTVVYNGYLHSTVSFAGRFYCCVGTRLMVLNNATADQQRRLVLAAEGSNPIYFSLMADSLHLVDNAGELMMVHRSLYQDPEHNYKRKYEVYRADLDDGVLVPGKGFNGRAIFMGCRRTISVAAETFPTITADTLYLGYDFRERKRIIGYNLADGSSNPSHNVPRAEMHPCSVIDCLSHCIGKELA
ncbi:hypothetical protein PR202_gb21351 [Eleusine coracana subsp. coracana]|uniref:KIB1-4 beta-propeller domain-containing protein n=1 Tax=Eleusine coracana subsp. coracana TaxID=191504 RepID=A0AAV5FEZ2_ELECO|nr:hypothetical protein PR202_gb21351 [Eleusine coracana subsp. coracana]